MKTIHCLSTISFLILFQSCRQEYKCDLPQDARYSYVDIHFKDKATGKYLYTEKNPMYNKDSLKVFDQYGDGLAVVSRLEWIPGSYDKYHVMSFGSIVNVKKDSAAFSGLVNRSFIVRYNATETDTIQMSFALMMEECGAVFSPGKISFRGKLLDSTVNTVSPSITLDK